MKKISTVIFDMDGVLIDSEPFWHTAEKEIFLREGVKITEEMCLGVQGLKAEHVIDKWKSMFPQLSRTSEDYAAEIESEVKKNIQQKGEPIQGVIFALDYLKSHGMKTAVASSSKYHLINAVLDKLEIRKYFDTIHSSEDEANGKPEPDVFLGAMRKLGSEPEDCVVIEDSGNGVLAGKRAGMIVVAVPPLEQFNLPCYDIADYKIQSLNDIENVFNQLKN